MPLLPTIGTIVSQSGALAEALGLTPDDLGFDQHQPIIVHLGPCSFLLVPVAGQAALMRARAGDGLRAFVSEAGSGAGMGLLLYSSQVRVADHALHLREWVFRDGIFREDLAHGAAVAALAGALVHFDHPCDGTHDMLLACGGHAEAQVQNQVQNQDQAPALVRLELEVTAGALTHVALAGTVRLSRQGQMIF
jgi:predicted PhzF superfamily epimerase YddE/YHI9